MGRLFRAIIFRILSISRLVSHLTRAKRVKLKDTEKFGTGYELIKSGDGHVPLTEETAKVTDRAKPAVPFNGYEALASPQSYETSLIAQSSAEEEDTGTKTLKEQTPHIPVGEQEPAQFIPAEPGNLLSEIGVFPAPVSTANEVDETKTDTFSENSIPGNDPELNPGPIAESGGANELPELPIPVLGGEGKTKETESVDESQPVPSSQEEGFKQPGHGASTAPPEALAPVVKPTDKVIAKPLPGEPERAETPVEDTKVLQASPSETNETQTGSEVELLPKPSVKKGTNRKKRTFNQPEYRPPALNPPSRTSGAPTPVQPPDRQGDTLSEPIGNRSLPIDVRVILERGGVCKVSLLPQRYQGLPEELTVATKLGPLQLEAMQDEWYQDVYINDIGTVLREGTVWYEENEETGHRWALSGREVYVLSDRPDLRGFISQTRLSLGHKHVILCTERLLPEVINAINETGAKTNEIANESLGAPPGWVIILGVKPGKSIPPGDEADIMNILRPLPEVEIGLEDGIRLEYSAWLESHPPEIRVYGEVDEAVQVLIDGQLATRKEDGSYSVPGYDSAGTHQVWCGGANKSYSIEKREPGWNIWDAHSFVEKSARKRRVAICGPLAHQCTDATETESLLLPETNPIVVGANPGEVTVGSRCSDIRFAPFIATLWFDPVWALPIAPLRSKKDMLHVVLIGKPENPHLLKRGRKLNKMESAALAAWCQSILEAGKKGLTTEPAAGEIHSLWRSYKKTARSLRRTLK